MSRGETITVSQRYPTKDDRITKIIIGDRGPNGIIIAKRIYYEVVRDEDKLIAMDWISALATLYDLDAPPELIDE